MSYKHECKLGDRVLYKNKKYIIVDIDFYYGGHFKIIKLVKLHPIFGICLVREVCEDDINKCVLIKESE